MKKFQVLENGHVLPFWDEATERKYWLYKFAGMAMQGLLATNEPVNDVISNSIEYAKQLLEQLEKNKIS